MAGVTPDAPVQVPPGLMATGHPIGIRHPDAERDSIDGVLPGLVLTPRTPEAVAAVLAWASAERRAVVVRGRGTRCGWGRPPAPPVVLLEMRALDRVLAHSRGDLTVSAEAGVTLDDLNGALAPHGQHLPIDPFFGGSGTIGGVLATNDSGALRHRFGTPRDLVIGVHLATADGRLVKAGGQVVKNVAGYDLSKLVSGSFGALAAIVSATFKLAPVGAASATVVIGDAPPEAFHRALNAVATSQLEPVAFDVHARRGPDGAGWSTRCLVRFSSVAEAVEDAAAECQARVRDAGAPAAVTRGGEEARLWCDYRASTGSAAVALRVSWLPADLPRVLDVVGGIAPSVVVELAGRVAAGAGALGMAGSVPDVALAVAALRRSDALRHVVVMRSPPELKSAVDVWGDVPNRPLLSAIKSALDPGGVLGAGRGPL
jgi:glycolate oxidase FAD binding subunit